jgi:hypothetical protein
MDSSSPAHSSTVRALHDGRVSFDGFNSWYTTPTELEPIFREALETGRGVRFRASVGCVILDAELMPLPPAVFPRIAGLLRTRGIHKWPFCLP